MVKTAVGGIDPLAQLFGGIHHIHQELPPGMTRYQELPDDKKARKGTTL
jgi:hypothetical protein